MSTESIQNPSKTLHKYYESYGVNLNATNGEATDTLTQGQAVYISGNGAVKAKKLGTQFPIGIVNVGALAGNQLSFKANVLCSSLAIATGANMAAGALVRYNGVKDENGIPQVVGADAGEYADAIVWVGGAAAAEITILVLRAPVIQGAGS